MFQRLKQKWKVNGTQLFLILCVFAITGTTTAWLTRQITYWLHLQSSDVWYWILKLIMLVFGYQVLILLFAIPFGQFNFFWNYEKKILRRMKLMSNRQLTIDNRQTAVSNQDASATQPQTTNNKQQTVRIALFASGAGSNAQKIIDHFRDHAFIKIALIVCNKPDAGVLNIAAANQIPALAIDKEKFFRGNSYVDELTAANIDFIVLAGFLWKIPTTLIKAFHRKMINIHPALLPKYGGKGMYGQFVHEAVITNKDKESGITIHYVDEVYDHGQIILQATCLVAEDDTPETLANKVQAVEHRHFPATVALLATL